MLQRSMTSGAMMDDDAGPMLKLMALDAQDLDVLSAHMQDATMRVDNLAYDARTRQFALSANRFVWEEAGTGIFSAWRRRFQRRLATLHVNRVTQVRSRGFVQSDTSRVLSLLSIQFFPDADPDSPSGEIELICADDVSIRLTVECIEVQLADRGPAWETRHRPHHPLSTD
jgi:hypothetical protein